MSRRIWVVLFAPILFIQPASAQTAPPVVPVDLKFPDPWPESCDTLYPAKLRAAGVEGTTVLSLNVLRDGSFTNIAIRESSGSADLDAAAVQCAKTTKRPPLTSGGQPIEVQWQAEVIWRQMGHTFVLLPISTACPVGSFYPTLAVRLNHEGETTFSYEIETDGTVGKFAIIQSSGYPELDQAVVQCTESLRFPPAMSDGKPVPIDRKSKMTWRLR